MAAWSVDESNPDDDWIYDLRADTHKQCQFLVRHNIIQPPLCPNCNSPFRARLLQTNRDLNKNSLPYRWICTSGQCDCSKPFVYGSYLHLHRKSAFKHIQLLYKFYLKRNATEAARETGFDPGIARKWFDYYRRCISKYMQEYFYPNFEFDLDHAVEFDEAALSAKQKHGRGRRRDPVWCLGGIQRDTGYIVLRVVDDRVRETLHGVILAFCPQGSTVITDGWRSYQGLSDHGRWHWSVNHAEGFVDPLTGWHTQTIECLWMLIRRELRSLRGVSAKYLQLHLDVFAFRRNMERATGNVWNSLCCVIGAMSPFVQRPTF